MDNAQFMDIVIKRQNYCLDLLNKKAAEYAPDEDRLENFKRAAGILQQSSAQALLGMLVKHWVSIAVMIETDQVGAQYGCLWKEKISDAINYMHLLEAVLVDFYGPDAVGCREARKCRNQP